MCRLLEGKSPRSGWKSTGALIRVPRGGDKCSLRVYSECSIVASGERPKASAQRRSMAEVGGDLFVNSWWVVTSGTRNEPARERVLSPSERGYVTYLYRLSECYDTDLLDYSSVRLQRAYERRERGSHRSYISCI